VPTRGHLCLRPSIPVALTVAHSSLLLPALSLHLSPPSVFISVFISIHVSALC
jgi:hypothetical protein